MSLRKNLGRNVAWSNITRVLIAFFAASGTPCFAHEGHDGGQSEAVFLQSSATGLAPGPGLVGSVELRPSWRGSSSEYFVESALELGYRLRPSVVLSYVQELKTKLHGINEKGAHEGLGLKTHDGYLRASLGRIWAGAGGSTSLWYESRLYVPTDKEHREAGMLAAWRHSLRLAHRVTPAITLSLTELPILHVYSRSGATNDAGHDHEHEVSHGKANPIFENRVYLSADFNLGRGVLLSVPVRLHATRYRRFQAEARLNDRWGFFAWLAPEISYALTPKTSVGLAYATDNLVRADLSGTAFSDGFRKSMVQAVLKTSI